MAYIKNPSEAQKKQWEKNAAEQKNAALEKIKGMAESYKDSPESMAEYFSFGSKFYDYSPKNTMLILSQNPHATYVQSYDAWKKLGYPVQAKEKGVRILVPVKSTFLKLSESEFVKLSQASEEQLKQYKAGKLESSTRMYFKIGSVFDISQTNFPPERYPEMFSVGYPSQLHDDICKGLVDYAAEQLKCPVKYSNLTSISLRGAFSPSLNEIRINDKLKDTQKLSTLSHELGHALIHAQPTTKSSAQKEFEADSISIMLQSNYGLELTDARKSHLADCYHAFKATILKDIEEEKQMKVLDEKMDEVFSTVFSVYKDNIELINECVQRYIPNEKLMQQQQEEQERDILSVGTNPLADMTGKIMAGQKANSIMKNPNIQAIAERASKQYSSQTKQLQQDRTFER